MGVRHASGPKTTIGDGDERDVPEPGIGDV